MNQYTYVTHTARHIILTGLLANLSRVHSLEMMYRCSQGLGDHASHVGAYASEIYMSWARKKGLSSATIGTVAARIRTAAELHDIGKLGVPAAILNKAGELTDEEYAIMKQHTVMGAKILAGHTGDDHNMAVQIALNHHERWDGTGYPGHIDQQTNQSRPEYKQASGNPRGKQGEAIPLPARIVAVADVYDALSSSRIYKKAWDEPHVLQEIQSGAGSRFDPEIVEAFFNSLDTIQHLKAA